MVDSNESLETNGQTDAREESASPSQTAAQIMNISDTVSEYL